MVAVAALVQFGALALPADIGGGTYNADNGEGVVDLTTDEATAQGAPTSSSGGKDQWRRHEICEAMMSTSEEVFMLAIPDCSAASPPIATSVICPDGAAPLPPWWVNRFVNDVYTGWQVASGYQCATDLLLAQIERAWETMPIAPNTYVVEPSAGFAIAELGVNLVVDTNPRTLDVTLMGTPVTIRAVPTQYAWTNTDGTTWTSTTPGRGFDDGGEPFTFPRVPEHRTTFTLTTTWRGEFSTNAGGTWRDAPGTATTTSGPTTVHVYNPHTHLVDCDLDGNCITGSQGGGNQNTILDPDGDGIDNYLIPDNQITDYLTTRAARHTWTDTTRKG